jgi:chitinase
MSYDLMNRRDNVTNHHASVEGAKKTVENYINIGAPPEKMNRTNSVDEALGHCQY